MVTVTIETLGAERFVRAFNRIASDMTDFREPFADIYDNFCGIEERSFKAQGLPDRWVPLSPRYAAWKRKHYPGKKILERTGALKAAMTGSGPGAVRVIGHRSAEFGTDIPYARYHQSGTRYMPRRKVVQLTDAMKVGWGRIIHQWAVATMKRELDAARASAGMDREFRGITK